MEFVYVVKRGELFERRFPHGLEVTGDAVLPAIYRGTQWLRASDTSTR